MKAPKRERLKEAFDDAADWNVTAVVVVVESRKRDIIRLLSSSYSKAEWALRMHSCTGWPHRDGSVKATYILASKFLIKSTPFCPVLR